MAFSQAELVELGGTFCGNKMDILTLLGHDTNLKVTKEKCGEIFKIDVDDCYEVLSVLCSFCGRLFRDFVLFATHVKQFHYIKISEQVHDTLKEPEIIIDSDLPGKVHVFHSDLNVLDIKHVDEFSVHKDLLPNQIQFSEVKREKKLVGFNEKHSKNHGMKLDKGDGTSGKRSQFRKCDICNKKFKSEALLRSHVKYDHIPTSPFVQTLNPIKNESVLSKMKREHEDCEINDKQNILEPTQENIDPFICRYCGKRYKNRERRFEHECLHTGEKTFKCGFCDKYFRQKALLAIHIEIHKNERNYKCEICGFGFNNKVNLKFHIRKHTGDKRYKCNYCDKKFITSTARKIHERIHTGEKPYQCAECGENFTTSSKLSAHKRKHSGEKPYQCKICNKRFTTSGDKKRHDTIHTGEKPVSCDICNSKFAHKKGLNQHKKIHSDVDSYHCQICSKGFKQHAGLYSHMKTHGVEKYSKSF